MSALGWLAALLLGGVGACLRLVVDATVAARAGRSFPAGTLVVNLSGALAAGAILGLSLGHDAALLAGTAFVGAYTTFSTWMLESERLGEEGALSGLVLNLGGSLVLGVAAVALGRVVGGQLG